MEWISMFRGFEAIKFGFFSENIENSGAAPQGWQCFFNFSIFKLFRRGFGKSIRQIFKTPLNSLGISGEIGKTLSVPPRLHLHPSHPPALGQPVFLPPSSVISCIRPSTYMMWFRRACHEIQGFVPKTQEKRNNVGRMFVFLSCSDPHVNAGVSRATCMDLYTENPR